MESEKLDNFGRTISGMADKVSRKTKTVTGEVKLRNQIYGLERDIQKDCEELGKKIYERYLESGETEEEFLSLCEEITEKQSLIDECNGKIEGMKENS